MNVLVKCNATATVQSRTLVLTRLAPNSYVPMGIFKG